MFSRFKSFPHPSIIDKLFCALFKMFADCHCILLTCYAEISGNENVWGNEKAFYLIFHRYAMEGEEGGSLNTNNLLPPVQILDPEAEMDQLPTGLYSYYFYF